MAKRIGFYLLFFIVSLFVLIYGIPDCSGPQKNLERYASKEIIIGKYDYKEGQPIVGKDGVNWWKLQSFQVAMDDLKRIYVLDVYRKKILQYSPEGALVRELDLKNAVIPYSDPDIYVEDSGPDSSIKVNRDGSYFYIITDEFIWTVFNNSGEPMKQKEIIPSTISLIRLCDDRLVTNYEVMDGQFNLLSKLKTTAWVQNDYPISDDIIYNYRHTYFTRRPYLMKMDSTRKVLWEKKVEGERIVREILGIDGNGNIYLLVGQPAGIVKLDNNGRFVARLDLPKEASDFMKNGIARGTYQVLCDGTIYYIPPMLYKHDTGYQGFISKGVKSIYKLE